MKKIFIILSLMFLAILFVLSSPHTNFASEIRGESEKSSFTLEVKGKLINLHAEKVSFKTILHELEKKSGIKVNIHEGVDDKQISLDIKALPTYAVSSLLEKMKIENFAVVYDKQLGSEIIYILPQGQNIAEIVKGKTIIKAAHFENVGKINHIKGKEILTVTKGPNNIPIRYVKDEVVLKFHRGVTKKEIETILNKYNLSMIDVDDGLSKIGYIKVRIPDGREVFDVTREIAKEYKLKRAEPNYISNVLGVIDPLYHNQWYVSDIQFDKAWAKIKNQNRIKVAVIDTGVDKEHPDLKDKILAGYDFVSNISEVTDKHGHGTFVAGIIASNSNDIGIKGLYDFADIIPVKVMDDNGIGTYEDVAKGIIYAVDNGAKVINLSIGGYGYSSMLQDAVDYALENGCVLVASGGNDGIKQEIYPAAYPDVIGVSAIGQDEKILSLSNSGKHIDVAASGENIISTGLNGQYTYSTGTSASTPMVSALAAMLLVERADLSSSTIQRVILQSAKDLGAKGRDKIYGSGKIDADSALEQKVKPFHDVAVRSVVLEPKTFEKGKPTFIVATIVNSGTFDSEKCVVVFYEIIGEIKKEIDRQDAVTVIDKLKVNFDWKPEGLKENIKFEVTVISKVDSNSSNNSKKSKKFLMREEGNLYILHDVDVPVHQWIALQASRIWSTSEILDHIDRYPQSVWDNGDDPYLKDDGYKPNGGIGGASKLILIGAGEEDKDETTEDTCIEFFGKGWLNPYCYHFWDPDYPQNGEYNDGVQFYGSNYRRAERVYSKAISKYLENNTNSINESYYWLGRTAHLLTDLCVPAHVHNDAHLPYVDDDEFEDFMKDDKIPNAWGENWYNFRKFLGVDYSGQYNYESLYVPAQVKTNPTNLFRLFWYTAQKTQYYASDEYDGNNKFFYENGQLHYFGTSGNNYPWNGENVKIISNHDEVEDFWGFGIIDNVRKIAEANIPHAMRAVAGLYRLFWNEIHPAPHIDDISPTSTVGSTFDLTINGSNFDSGAVDQVYWAADGHFVGQAKAVLTRSSTRLVVREDMTGAQAGTYIIKVKNSDGQISNGTNLEITSSGALSVTPAEGFSSSGTQGGPFTPPSKIYTLQNTGGSSINWSAGKSANWVSLSGTSGTLPAGASTTVTVSINSNANILSPDTYNDTVSFTDGSGNITRSVTLTISQSGVTFTCQNPKVLSFGASYRGDTHNGVNVTEEYYVNGDRYAYNKGKEQVHSFTINYTQSVLINAKINDFNQSGGDLSLFLVTNCGGITNSSGIAVLDVIDGTISQELSPGTYYLIVDSHIGEEGEYELTLTGVCTAPSITSHPQSQTIQSGETATLYVSATGTAPLSYQWYRGSSGDTSTPVGSNSSSYTTPALTQTTNYWVKVSNSCDSANSNTATVTVATQGNGSIRVSIVPQEAADAGAQWKLTNDTTWYNSGNIIYNLPFGTYQVEFKTIAGWNTPPNKEVTISIVNPDIWINSDPYTLKACPPPNTPTNLTATSSSPFQINLGWQDNSSDESDFHIERSPNGSTWTEIGMVGANVTSFSDTGRSCNTPYYYRVRGHRHSDGLYSDYSTTANATTQACPPARWSAISLPSVSSDWELRDVHFTSSAEGWAVGVDWKNYIGALLHYSNGSWTSISPPYVATWWEGLHGVHFTSSNEGWAVGQNGSNTRGVLLHYSNNSWASVDLPVVSSYWWLFGAHFTSSNEGWAVGRDESNTRGVLLHYSNGFWNSVTPPNVSTNWWWLYGVHFTSPNEGWAVGWQASNNCGVLLHYSNASWTLVTPPNVSGAWELRSVHFTSSNEGWAVGSDGLNDRGVLLHYSDGSWTSVTPPNVSSSWELYDIYFTSSNEGWAVGKDLTNQRGVLLHYPNGSWTSVTPPNVSSSWELRGVHFPSSGEGWAVGEDITNRKGVLLKYSSSDIIQNTIYVSKDGLCNGNNPCFPNIQNGIASASGPSIIKITQETYNGDIILDFNETIYLQGGWDTNFTSSSSYTIINGSITITNGKMIIEWIILE